MNDNRSDKWSEGVFSGNHYRPDKNKHDLPQVPKDVTSDGHDVEFADDNFDHEDQEALTRANQANKRVNACSRL